MAPPRQVGPVVVDVGTARVATSLRIEGLWRVQKVLHSVMSSISIWEERVVLVAVRYSDDS